VPPNYIDRKLYRREKAFTYNMRISFMRHGVIALLQLLSQRPHPCVPAFGWNRIRPWAVIQQQRVAMIVVASFKVWIEIQNLQLLIQKSWVTSTYLPNLYISWW